MSKKRFRPQICLILQQSCCLYSKSCCWIIRSCRYFSKVVSELSVFLTSWILARGDPFLKAHFQFGAEPWLRAGEGISLVRRSTGRLGVPPGGAEQGSASRRRGMVPGKYSCDFWRRLFLAVFPTADKLRRTRPGTELTAKMRQSRKNPIPPHFSLFVAFNSLTIIVMASICVSVSPSTLIDLLFTVPKR